MKEFLDFTKNLIGLILILWILFTFVIGIKTVQNNDMNPRLQAGDVIVYFKLDNDLKSQDLVILNKDGEEYIGRIVAKGGDTVNITPESALIINGNNVSEQNIFYETVQYEGFVEYPLTLEKDEIFVLCDMREGGKDSRYYGPVKKSDIKGTVLVSFRRGSN